MAETAGKSALGLKLGGLVRECRQARQMSQGELAEILGTTQSQVSDIENRGNFNLTTLEAVASAVDAVLVVEMRLRP